MRGILPRKPTLRPGLFEPDNLVDDGLENALSECKTMLTETTVELVVEELLFKPNLIELVISAMGESSPLCKWILDQFPNDATAFPSSLPAMLLSRISLSLLFLDHTFSRETLETLKKYRRSVELALKALEALTSISFPAWKVDTPTTPGDEDEDITIVVKMKNKSQRRNKQAKRSGLIAVDAKPFQNIGVSVPSTPEEARELAQSILQEQKQILEFCFDRLCSPEVSEAIKRTYLPKNSQTDLEAYTQEKVDVIPSVEDIGTEEIPTIYPIVQPMKAALYFDNAEGFGEWRILISTGADGHLRVARKTDAKIFRIIIKKIKELSNGHFSDDNHKRLNGPNSAIPIYEAKMTRDLRLVYQVDCLPEYDSNVERQVLKVFGIYTHAQLDGRLWNSMSCQLSKKGKEYRSRCTFRNKPLYTGDNVVLPASFPPQTEPVCLDPSTNVPDIPPQDLDEIHSLLVLEKFITFSQALLNSILADQDVAHVFDVTSQEREIIEHTRSCYVLGRSGTGKTTTMLFKMLGIERAWDLRRSTMLKPRQIFVTQSRVLAGKVEEYFTKLLQSLETASRTPEELVALAMKKKSRQEEDDLIDLDDEADWRSDLPGRFSLLKDEHFPLFITFDRLCKLLENDIAAEGPPTVALQSFPESDPTHIWGETPGKRRQKVGTLVSYSVFLESYWPHFPQTLTRGLDPSLVFSEFIGVIKGSGEALAHSDRYVDRQTYESLSYRSHATFPTQRNIIYTIFQSHMKRKRERGDYDAADRTHSILKKLQTCGVPGQQIDYLYVDEVQDNLLIDAFLLRLLCRNPDGLFWAGDTAQTISVGSSFRFNDLKAFLFRVELSRQKQNACTHLIPQPTEPPKTFQLAINYRSHGGIVNCAHSVIELITKFWPYSIDLLAQETGIVDGLKPVFFSGWDQDTVRYEQFLFGETGNHIEFGAQQCILVRDDAARDKLRGQVGNIGLIMTLYESKGLEFSDVLLYNFFQDSTVDLSQWRVVLNALEDGQHTAFSAPHFDESRHAGVCSELKSLYVAITRARKNMWIVDCSEKSNPMRVFWTCRNQVQNCTPGTDVPQLAVTSTPQEWAVSGKTLFQNKRYLQAMHCFERASMHREVAVAEAYYLREQARAPFTSLRQSPARSRASLFSSAGEAFLECATIAKTEMRVYFRTAGDCFEHSGDGPRAAQAYLDGEEFDLAAKLYRKLGAFDKAVQVVKNHKDMMQTNIADGVIDVARLFYLKEHDFQKANDLFTSYEEELEYLEDRYLDVARATLLISLGRTADAAEIYLADGRTLEAIDLFLQDKENVSSMRRGNECILQGLWENLSFGLTRESARLNLDLQKLLSLTAQLNIALLDPGARDEILMFQAIMSGEPARLQELGERFALTGRVAPAILCLDYSFDHPPQIQVLRSYDVAIILRVFLVYSRLLHTIAFDPDPCNNPSIQKLFGFRCLAENSFQILPGTFLHRTITDIQISALQPDNRVAGPDLTRIFRQSLRDRLRRRVLEENAMCRNAQAFSPCLTFTVYGYCNRLECPHEHVAAATLDNVWYNLRVRLHLQQILIYQSLRSVEPRSEQLWQKSYWVGKLYEALNPPFYLFGTPANLSTALIPEAQRGFQVVKDWVRSLLDTLNPTSYRLQTTFLTTAIRTINLSFSFDRRQAVEYVYRAPFVSVYKPPGFFRGKEDQYIVKDLVASLQGTEIWSLSGGILSIKHIISQRLTIEIGVLCNFIDYLCGSLVLTARCPPHVVLHVVPHNVTLPRSWLLTLLQHGVTARDLQCLWMIVEPLAELLEQLYSGGPNAEHLLFENTNLSKLTLVRNVFIARICRSLCLLGYNINNLRLRNSVSQAITSLQRRDPCRRFPGLYHRYIFARGWNDLAREVRQSTTGSPMDELILVCHPSGGFFTAPTGTRRIVVSTLQELARVLDRSSHSALRHDAIPFVPSGNSEIKENVQGVTADELAEVDMIDEAAEIEEGEVEEVEPHPMEAENVGAVDIPQSWQPVAAPSEQQIDAAHVIQAVYSRTILRGRGVAKASLPAARARHFAAFYSEAQDLDWPLRYYRLLFLGPLPHILVCLEFSAVYTHALKEKAKRRFNNSQHQELEEVGNRLTFVGGILKDIQRLRKALGPKADVHRRRNLEELKALVLQVEALVHRLPPGIPYDLQHDLSLGVKGIVTTNRVSRKRRPKPVLVIEEDL